LILNRCTLTDQWYGVGTGLGVQTAGNNDLGNPIRNSVADGGGVIFPGVYADGTIKKHNKNSLF
jgi:hypothetical protein